MTGENCIQFGLLGMCRAAREVLFQPLGMLSIQVLPHSWPLDSLCSACNFPVKTNQTCQTPNWFTSGQESFLPLVRLSEDTGRGQSGARFHQCETMSCAESCSEAERCGNRPRTNCGTVGPDSRSAPELRESSDRQGVSDRVGTGSKLTSVQRSRTNRTH